MKKKKKKRKKETQTKLAFAGNLNHLLAWILEETTKCLLLLDSVDWTLSAWVPILCRQTSYTRAPLLPGPGSASAYARSPATTIYRMMKEKKPEEFLRVFSVATRQQQT